MEQSLRIRQMLFDEVLMKREKNRENWEMLCCSEKPMVPFVGAGLSAWCYPTWTGLLMEIIKKNFPENCGPIVERALKFAVKPSVSNKEGFHWMEEIAECIFNENRAGAEEEFILTIEDKGRVNLGPEDKGVGRVKEMEEANICLRDLRRYVGDESKDRKQKALKDLFQHFDSEKLKDGRRMPEYLHLLHKLFHNILVTTNYDKALECCYPSILNYSYDDLDKPDGPVYSAGPGDTKKKGSSNHNWLFRAMIAKLDREQARLDGDKTFLENMAVPDYPMLLKVHGSIEKADSLALSRKGYENAYGGEMPVFLEQLFEKSTLIFLGCRLVEDRVLDKLEAVVECSRLKKQKEEIRHFAFLRYDEKEEEKRRYRLKRCGIYPIYYYDDILEEYFGSEAQISDTHNYFLGLLLENLLRRKIYHPQPQELLWLKNRFEDIDLHRLLDTEKKKKLLGGEPQYIRRSQAAQIRDMLAAGEQPLIAVTGKTGSGKSTLCENVRDLQSRHLDSMQFFHISLAGCLSWEDFCMRVYQGMNILQLEAPARKSWREFARLIAERCGAFWKSVLVLDCLDELKTSGLGPKLWDTVKSLLAYWRERQVRIIITCRDYPADIPCPVWNLEKLEQAEAERVFFSSCTLKRTREVSYLEKKTLSELFSRQSFQPSYVYLMGDYANSKSDLTSLLEEWRLYHKAEDPGEQTLARILWNNLLDEHRYHDENEQAREYIKRNIIWVWGILENYPGVFPSAFFASYLEESGGFKGKRITEHTLMYMKNDGLCKEEEDVNQTVLLHNMKECVKKYFVEPLQVERDGLVKKWFGTFDDRVNHYENSVGLECFRGYHMPDYVKDLKENMLNEYLGYSAAGEERSRVSNPARDIFEILELLSKKVNTNDGRNQKENRALNLVLHYEIKTIIRFMITLLDKQADTGIPVKRLIETSCNFSHYFHYVPNDAHPLVKQLLELVDKGEYEKEIDLCMQADLNCAMGDIQRLMARKNKAEAYYKRAIQLSGKQVIGSFEGDRNGYEQGLRRMAAAGLISNYYSDGLESRLGKMEESLKCYEGLKDNCGAAYSHQRLGEKIFADTPDSERNKTNFQEILEHYNQASALFYKENGMTSYAYMLKCLGDLAVNYNMIPELDQLSGYTLAESDTGGIVLQKSRDAIKRESAWHKIAAACYLNAFAYYCENIDWRGLANVIQAMCTYYRVIANYTSSEYIKPIEKLYGLAEECYRWLGDIRGLSDTLDFFGYAYIRYMHWLKGQKDTEYKTYGYKALGKWMESREMWRQQGNNRKAEKVRTEIEKLKDELREDAQSACD